MSAVGGRTKIEHTKKEENEYEQESVTRYETVRIAEENHFVAKKRNVHEREEQLQR
jgi:hypothetical protein